MKRMLFTIPDNIAHSIREFIPAGERSEFVVRYIQIPLRELQKKGGRKKKKSTASLYKPKFLKDLAKAERQADRGEAYTHEAVMKKLGLL
jgi:hypothetical protein